MLTFGDSVGVGAMNDAIYLDIKDFRQWWSIKVVLAQGCTGLIALFDVFLDQSTAPFHPHFEVGQVHGEEEVGFEDLKDA